MFERFSDSARVAVVLAQEQARELAADEIRPEHILVGVLQSAGHALSRLLADHGLTAEGVRNHLFAADSSPDECFDDDAESLRSLGIDLGAVRDSVARTFGSEVFDNALRRSGRRRRRAHLAFTKSSKKVLELALREALLHKDNVISGEHILLGILRGGDTFTVGLITDHAPAPQFRSALIELLENPA